ncbi:9469_t:CDS:1 [Funneliformis geosporum]|uniref:16408_t:CDS:1 n=1 Tax=Funneliformis geosporum TaxID=1117311 RepID=A0A9W4SUB3_9GLOM|nr:9469_t:CDS:1 [Funneliformis geosporum]CAI2180840.1 16408_t:CDS:1 [Funneliformis geosporum]
MKHHNQELARNHQFWPFLILDQNKHWVIVFSLSSEGLFVLSMFSFPSTRMTLEICRENSSRSPNSFIIFRTFFSRSLNIPTISSFDVGKISVLAQSVWNVASEKMKNAFSQLSKNAANYLRAIRAPSFINHKPSKHFSTSKINDSTFERNESPPSKERNLHPLSFEIMTAKDFRTDEPKMDSIDFQFNDDMIPFLFNESNFYFFDLYSLEQMTYYTSPPSHPPGEIFAQGYPLEISADTTSFFEGNQNQESYSKPEPKETIIKFDDTADYENFFGYFSEEDKVGLQFTNRDSIFF